MQDAGFGRNKSCILLQKGEAERNERKGARLPASTQERLRARVGNRGTQRGTFFTRDKCLSSKHKKSGNAGVLAV